MKKLLALLLSLIMAMSLTVPALAMEEAVPISALLPEASPDVALGIIGGADGPTAIISGALNGWDFAGLGTQEFDTAAELAKYEAAHPGIREELRANAYDYFAQEYGYEGYFTAQEYMEQMGYTEEEFLDEMAEEQLWELAYGEWSRQLEQRQRDALKEALGGVPGQVGVMVNGEYIQFPDAAPEVTGGRTMVPVRALVETLGGEVDYQDDVVTFIMDGYAYELAIGSTTVAVSPTADNDKDVPQPEDIEMDCAPYIKGGRTYVPVRFIAEALGYEVGWDGEYETAILLDREALAEQYDESFTIMNKVQANRVAGWEKDKTLSTDVKCGLSLTLFDTLNGSKTYKADLTGNTLMNSEAASGTCSFTLSDNTVDALEELLFDEYDAPADAEMFRTVLTGLKDMEVILNWDGQVWVHAPILDELYGEENVWGAMELSSEELQVVFVDADAATMGTALAAMVSTDSVVMWSSTNAIASFAAELYMDEKFTTSGGVSTLTIGLDELMALYEKMGIAPGEVEDEIRDIFKTYEIIMKVDSRGGATVTAKLETKAQSGVPGIKMTMDCTQSGGRASITMDMHVANMGELKLTMDTTQKTVNDQPMTEPPEGATIIEEGASIPSPLPEPAEP